MGLPGERDPLKYFPAALRSMAPLTFACVLFIRRANGPPDKKRSINYVRFTAAGTR